MAKILYHRSRYPGIERSISAMVLRYLSGDWISTTTTMLFMKNDIKFKHKKSKWSVKILINWGEITMPAFYIVAPIRLNVLLLFVRKLKNCHICTYVSILYKGLYLTIKVTVGVLASNSTRPPSGKVLTTKINKKNWIFFCCHFKYIFT